MDPQLFNWRYLLALSPSMVTKRFPRSLFISTKLATKLLLIFALYILVEQRPKSTETVVVVASIYKIWVDFFQITPTKMKTVKT
jgi:hypothetical protein